jgi:hypothetical protein
MTRLHLHGPYPLCSTAQDVLGVCPHAELAGVYLWAVPTIPHGLVVDYVGETSASFYRRTKEHVIQILGGNYLLLDPDALLRGERQVVWPGLWRAGTRDQLPTFLTRLEELAPVARRYLSLHKVMVAPLECEPRLQHRIEASIAAAVQDSQPRLVATDIRYRGRRADEEPIPVAITADCHVHGLPSHVAA